MTMLIRKMNIFFCLSWHPDEMSINLFARIHSVISDTFCYSSHNTLLNIFNPLIGKSCRHYMQYWAIG